MADPKQTKLFFGMSPEDIETIKTQPVTVNGHNYAVSPDKFKQDPGIAAFWDVLTLNEDIKGQLFVSAMEAKRYPFFGLQFHPEIAQTPSSRSLSMVNLSWEAIQAQTYFGKFFVSLARANKQEFEASGLDIDKEVLENHTFYRLPKSQGDFWAF